MNELKIEIPSLPENIRIVESFIDSAQEKYEFGDDMYGNVMVAVTESVNNAILHGNKSDAKKNVSISLLMDETKLTFIIADQGPGFEFDNLPDPTAPENLEKVGGRGIFLMRNLADDVSFEDEGRKVTIEFKMA